jgi:N6-adenosine-specific RNA methylase IME4
MLHPFASPIGQFPPPEITEAQWEAFGFVIAPKVRDAKWQLGDWFNAHRPEWGNIAKFFNLPAWKAAHLPSHNVCREAGRVCRRWGYAWRHANLDFEHYRIASAKKVADPHALIEWCRTSHPHRVRTTRELEGEKHRRLTRTGQPVSTDTCTVATLAELKRHFYHVVYADPAWPYKDQTVRSATANHFPSMPFAEIKATPVRDFTTADSYLFLWAPHSMLKEALEVVEAWGYQYCSQVVWIKPEMGRGRYFRICHEHLLVGVRGDVKIFNDKSLRSWHMVSREGLDHSEKPEYFRKLIEKATCGPYVELFARKEEVPGWVTWGNQVSLKAFRTACADVAPLMIENDRQDAAD